MLWFPLAAAAVGSTATPRQTVEQAVTTVVGLLRPTGPAGQFSTVVRTTSPDHAPQIRRVAERLFDADEVARRALMHHWAARTPRERTQFVSLFKEVLERTYIRKIELYSGEQIVVVGERIDGPTATVFSRITRPKTRETTALDYRLHMKDGRWQAYDVLIDGVSFVANYRSQFDRIIRQSSYDAMIEQLRQNLEGQAEPAAASPGTGGHLRKVPGSVR